MIDNLKQKTASAFAWSMLQSWSVKFLSLLLFYVLARYLAPEQMGLAQSVTLILAFVAIISEQGFHSAIVQRPVLNSIDVNLPFFISITVASIASAVMLLFAESIAVWIKEPAASNLIRMAAFIPPLTAANGILVAMLRRELNFKVIARASFIASFISGIIALILVTNGWGPMALVVQAAISGLVTSIFVWFRAGWKPHFQFETNIFKKILKYSSATFASQIIDFFSNRLMDLIILTRYGLTALGIFAVGSKLYLTVLELLATALTVVAMSAMSKLVNDDTRLKSAYLRFIFLAACTTTPMFAAIAALSPEICEILFGNKWGDAVSVTRWLCILGSVQVVQFFNGAVLDATGYPRRSLAINLIKLSVGAGVLFVFPASSITELTIAYVCSQFLVSPLSFGMAMQVTKTSARSIFFQISPGFLAAICGYFIVVIMRSFGQQSMGFNSWLNLMLFGSAFFITFVVIVFVQCHKKIISEIQYGMSGFNTETLFGVGVYRKLMSLTHQSLLFLFWKIAQILASHHFRTRTNVGCVLFIPGDTTHLVGSRGDSAMLDSALDQVKRNFPNGKTYIACSSTEASDVATIRNCSSFLVWGGVSMPFNFLRALRQIEPSVGLIMGADVMDGHYSPVMSLRMLIAADLMARYGVDSRFLGFSLNAQVPFLVKAAFRGLNTKVKINLRDPISLDRFNKIVGRGGNLVADTAFLLLPEIKTHEPLKIIEWIAAQKRLGKIVLGINFHPMLFSKINTNEKTQKLARSLAVSMFNIQSYINISWILIPHDDRVNVGDILALEKLLLQLPEEVKRSTYRVLVPPEAKEIKAIVGELDGVVTGRMHLAIATLGQGVPVITFDYQGKFEGLMRHFRFPDWLVVDPVDAIDATLLTELISRFITELPDLKLQVCQMLPNVLAATNATFEGIECI